MKYERRPRGPMSALTRTAIALLAAVQVIVAFAPLLETRFEPGAPTHIEATGTSAHHVHNSEACAACAARGLMVGANRSENTLVESSRRTYLVAANRYDHLVEFLKGSNSRPRAPPVRHA